MIKKLVGKIHVTLLVLLTFIDCIDDFFITVKLSDETIHTTVLCY